MYPTLERTSKKLLFNLCLTKRVKMLMMQIEKTEIIAIFLLRPALEKNKAI